MIENNSFTSLREDVYRLLAACYYPPTAELIAENCCASLAALLKQSVPDAASHAKEAAQVMGVALEPLTVENARLFIGPFQLVAPPYGSLYLDDAKTVMGESTVRVAALYQSCGLQLADDFFELPDHITVELEFMSYLAYQERAAILAGKTDEANRQVARQRDFLAVYLLPWLQPFTQAIINDGESPFYQELALCTAAFVAADYAALTATAHG
jgi:putative dimethyl sulfoxide reductase chaperone